MAAGVVAVVVVLLVGVGIGMSMSSGATAASATPTVSSPADDTAPTTASGEAPTTPLTFGTTTEVAPGVTARVEKPLRWKPSSIAAGADGAERVVRSKVTLTNRTGRYINFSEVLYTDMTIQGASTQSVTDGCGEQNGTCGLRNVATKPGGAESFGVAWVVPATPVDIGLSMYTEDYSAPKFSWAGDA